MRYRLTIEYDGTDFKGWQIQPDARTVEGELEAAFKKVLQRTVDIVGQGRTDTGVHAYGQTAHIDLLEMDGLKKLVHAVNSLTSADVHVRKIEEADNEFHARFDASSRMYEYRMISRPSPLQDRYAAALPKKINIPKMLQVAELFKGEHDFSGFSKKGDEHQTPMCTVYESEMMEDVRSYVYRIRANRFLRNMVRRIVGALIDVGTGALTVEEVEAILKNGEELKSTTTAPAKGLKLVKVFY